VAVRLIVEREREIEAFDAEEYWSIHAELSQQKYDNGNGPSERPYFTAKFHKFKGEDPLLDSETAVQPHLDALENAHWAVGEVRLGQRTRRPAAPFTTSTLQQEASRKLNFGASKTMRIAQQLYEGVDLKGETGTTGLITYMRTDSVTVSKDSQNEARSYIGDKFGADYVPAEPPTYKTKAKAAQEAHEAIRPTSVSWMPKVHQIPTDAGPAPVVPFNLGALCGQPDGARPEYDTVSTDIYAGELKVVVLERPYLFRATGSTLRFAGFLALYEETRPEDKPDDDDLEHPVPSDLQENEVLDLLQLLPEQHFTQPPPRYSEASLVKAMEEHGIGRPSTYAAILSTIQKRGYVKSKEKRLVPTKTGRVVNDLLVEHFPNVMSVDFTARLEDELDQIAEGEKEWVPVIDGFYREFATNLAAADEAIEKIDLKKEPELVGRECPQCGSPLLYREGRYGRFIGCSNFPKCRHTEQILVKVGSTAPTVVTAI
jgi:DNA topoisomerase I